MRIYDHELPTDPEEFDLLTIEEFNLGQVNNTHTGEDGIGYWVKDGKESREAHVFESNQLDATHVAWYSR